MNRNDDFEKVDIEIENFGPIKNANINLKPLTIFVGPNNSGKSYLAILIHALTYHLNDSLYEEIIPDGFWDNLSLSILQIGIKYNPNSFKNFINIFNVYLDRKNEEENLIVPKKIVHDLIKSGISEFFCDMIKKNLETFYSCNLNELVLSGQNSFKIKKNDLSLILEGEKLKIIEFPEITLNKSKNKMFTEFDNVFRKFGIQEIDENYLIDLNFDSLYKELDEKESRIAVIILVQLFRDLLFPY